MVDETRGWNRERPPNQGIPVGPDETWRASQFQRHYTILHVICKHTNFGGGSWIISGLFFDYPPP